MLVNSFFIFLKTFFIFKKVQYFSYKKHQKKTQCFVYRQIYQKEIQQHKKSIDFFYIHLNIRRIMII